jgi:cytochrome P450 family 4
MDWNTDHFPNPEKFDPDNFLPEILAKRHRYTFIPFNAGFRNCIGQKYTLLDEKTVLSSIPRHYNMWSLDKKEDIHLMAELILRPEDGLQGIISCFM